MENAPRINEEAKRTMSNPPFMIVPSDKRILKSSKVRAYFKQLNDILAPDKEKIMQDVTDMQIDLMVYGYAKMKS